MDFLKNNWIYMVIAFAIVFLVGIGYITYTRLNELTVRDTIQPQPTSAPSPAPADEVELTFQITPAVREAEGLTCIELVAVPLEGPSPLTVSFTGLASDTSSSIQFNFDFGDGSVESIEKEAATSASSVTQSTTHTYIDQGVYEAALTVESENGQHTSSACTITIDVTGASIAQSVSPTVGPTLIAQAPTATPAIDSSAPQADPTTSPIGGLDDPTEEPTATPTDIPAPTPTTEIVAAVTTPLPTAQVAVPVVPEAGSFLPTALAVIGGILILFLAFAIS